MKEEEFLQLIKERSDRRRSLSVIQKINYLITDFQVDWACRKYYKKTWFLSHINLFKIAMFLLPRRKKEQEEMSDIN